MRHLNTMLFKLLGITLGFVAISSYAQAQDFVDTKPQNKNLILEEFTGLNCPFCPDGHKIANNIRANNPGDVVLINIHTGSYAKPQNEQQPDYRSGYGRKLAAELGVRGFPTASLNRTSINGNKVLGRGKWENAIQQILQESSPVNVGVRARINPDTRKLTVNVEMYYTSKSSSNTNKLNVALLQNDVYGPQKVSPRVSYPEKRRKDGKYEHEHMLREFLTGQWGEEINKTEKGDFVEKTYTYNVPEDYNDVPVNIENLEVAAYVAKGKENILSGTRDTVKVSRQSGINRSDASNLQTAVYPNPASNNVNIDFKLTKPSPVNIEIYNAKGQKVKTLNEGNYRVGLNSVNLDVTEWDVGLYTAQFQVDGQIHSKRFVVTN